MSRGRHKTRKIGSTKKLHKTSKKLIEKVCPTRARVPKVIQGILGWWWWCFRFESHTASNLVLILLRNYVSMLHMLLFYEFSHPPLALFHFFPSRRSSLDRLLLMSCLMMCWWKLSPSAERITARHTKLVLLLVFFNFCLRNSYFGPTSLPTTWWWWWGGYNKTWRRKHNHAHER